jgi:methionyl-tRNA formyltransferase
MLRSIFLGTPEFVIPSLKVLLNHPKIDLVQIVSSPDVKSGRGMSLSSSPVALFAKRHQLSLLQTSDINGDIHKLKSTDIIVCFAFSQFLNQKVLQYPELGAFNIHTSLLPRYRGAAPIYHALLANDPMTGVTIQKMALKMDSGDIALQKELPILPEDDYSTLLAKFSDLSALALEEFIDNFEKIDLQPQGDVYSLAPAIRKSDGIITKECSYAEFLGKFRAFKLWPKVKFIYHNIPITIYGHLPSRAISIPGEFKICDDKVILGLNDRSIEITALQFPSRNILSGEAMLSRVRQFFRESL